MSSANLSWRDRIQLLNSVLFCAAGMALIVRYFMVSAPFMTIVLGVVFLAFGCYRLVLARRELQKRIRNHA